MSLLLLFHSESSEPSENSWITFSLVSQAAIVLSIEANNSMSEDGGLVLFVSSDNNLSITGAKTSIDESYINSGTASWYLYDYAGAAVTSGTGAFTALGSSGNWTSTIPSTVAITAGSRYFLQVSIASGSADVTYRREAIAAYYEG